MAQRTVNSDRKPKIEELTQEQVMKRLDRQAKRLLGISGEEFLRRFRGGELTYTPEELSLSFLAELVR